jgi:hypothetical protein
MEPDPTALADTINGIHQHWGIRYRLTPTEALHIVCLRGILAAEKIRASTVRVAGQQRIGLPDSVASRFEAPAEGATPEHIPTEGTHALHESLTAHPALLDGVTAIIDDKAARIRAASGAQQQAALLEEAAKAAAAGVAPQE